MLLIGDPPSASRLGFGFDLPMVHQLADPHRKERLVDPEVARFPALIIGVQAGLTQEKNHDVVLAGKELQVREDEGDLSGRGRRHHALHMSSDAVTSDVVIPTDDHAEIDDCGRIWDLVGDRDRHVLAGLKLGPWALTRLRR